MVRSLLVADEPAERPIFGMVRYMSLGIAVMRFSSPVRSLTVAVPLGAGMRTRVGLLI